MAEDERPNMRIATDRAFPLLIVVSLLALTITGCGAADAGGGSATDVCAGLTYSEEDPSEFWLGGNVLQNDDAPVAGVHITVTGAGYDAEICSNSEGKWAVTPRIDQPYTVVVDDDTLPKSTRIASPEGIGSTGIETEFGPASGGRRVVNIFLDRGVEGEAGLPEIGSQDCGPYKPGSSPTWVITEVSIDSFEPPVPVSGLRPPDCAFHAEYGENEVREVYQYWKISDEAEISRIAEVIESAYAAEGWTFQRASTPMHSHYTDPRTGEVEMSTDFRDFYEPMFYRVLFFVDE